MMDSGLGVKEFKWCRSMRSELGYIKTISGGPFIILGDSMNKVVQVQGLSVEYQIGDEEAQADAEKLAVESYYTSLNFLLSKKKDGDAIVYLDSPVMRIADVVPEKETAPVTKRTVTASAQMALIQESICRSTCVPMIF